MWEGLYCALLWLVNTLSKVIFCEKNLFSLNVKQKSFMTFLRKKKQKTFPNVYSADTLSIDFNYRKLDILSKWHAIKKKKILLY